MRIVLVDPSRAVQMALAQMLGARGHAVTPFSCPEAALYRITEDPCIDGVITAAEMVPLTGVELCWEVRLLAERQRPIYTLLMSSHLDERGMIEALDAGADDIISKPPRSQELYARIRVGERLLSAQKELISLATTDPMTGLLNRRAFFQRGGELCANGAGHPISAILLDVDHFKEINDLYGHQTGDQTLREVAQVLKSAGTLVGRLGGDELCLLGSLRDMGQVLKIAEDLRSRISDLKVRTRDGHASITCSLGVAQGSGRSGLDSIIRDADLALYRAKQEGRNCVATPPSDLKLSRSGGCGIARRRPR